MTGTDLPPLPSLGGLPPLPTLGPVSRRPPPAGARRAWQQARVVALHDETDRARTFRLEVPQGESHVPGQHYVVRVTADDGSSASRSYSIASAPEPGHRTGTPTQVELSVERIADGSVSPYLHDEVRVGDQVEVRGPFGGWFVWRGDTPALLVGGGSGVVPLASMLRHWRLGGQRVPLQLAVSVREPADLFYAGEYGPETTIVYTRQAPPGYPRPPGRLDAATLAPLVAAAGAGATAYVCGSAGFAEAASQLLVELGVDAGMVRVERFGPS